MNTIKERLAVLETQIKALQKLVWILVLATLGQVGIEFIPL